MQRELHIPVVYTSTGRGTAPGGVNGWVDASNCDRVGFYIETTSGSTATIQVESARDSTSVAVPLGGTVNLNASSGTFLQFDGPFAVVSARVTDGASTGVRVLIVGV